VGDDAWGGETTWERVTMRGRWTRRSGVTMWVRAGRKGEVRETVLANCTKSTLRWFPFHLKFESLHLVGCLRFSISARAPRARVLWVIEWVHGLLKGGREL
jgi:hypothetical protein